MIERAHISKKRIAVALAVVAHVLAFGIYYMSGGFRLGENDDAHRVSSLDMRWELRETEWREAEGLFALQTKVIPIAGAGRLPQDLETVGAAFCEALLAPLPPDAPVTSRTDVFRVTAILPGNPSTNHKQIEIPVFVEEGACKPIAQGKWLRLGYPGLSPDWFLHDWKADTHKLDNFRVLFRRTGDQPLRSLDVERACRAALFDLPALLKEFHEAFAELGSIIIIADDGVGSGPSPFSRSVGWSVPISAAGCGPAEEISL